MSNAEKLSQNRYSTLAEKYAFIDGYEQAEKDLELTWEDVRDILNIYEEVIDMDSCEDIYGEVLKRFRDYKEKRK